jgi:hypothetical protein
MSSSKPFFAVSALLVLTAALVEAATGVDMRDPRRAVGREDDVRVDAELCGDSVGAGLLVVYEVTNLTSAPVAIADVPPVASLDRDSGTITFNVGAEIPTGPTIPRLVTIKPGEKKTFRSGATLHVATPEVRTRYAAVPRAVQIKVNVLRDLEPFQTPAAAKTRIDDKLFELWINSNVPVITNAIPVRWNPAKTSIVDASTKGPSAGSW